MTLLRDLCVPVPSRLVGEQGGRGPTYFCFFSVFWEPLGRARMGAHSTVPLSVGQRMLFSTFREAVLAFLKGQECTSQVDGTSSPALRAVEGGDFLSKTAGVLLSSLPVAYLQILGSQ